MNLSSGVRLQDGSYIHPSIPFIEYVFYGLDFSETRSLKNGVEKLEEHAQAIENMNKAVFKAAGFVGKSIGEATVFLREFKEAIGDAVWLDKDIDILSRKTDDPEGQKKALAKRFTWDKARGDLLKKPSQVFDKAIRAHADIQTAIKSQLQQGWASIEPILIKAIGKDGSWKSSVEISDRSGAYVLGIGTNKYLKEALASEAEKMVKPKGMAKEVYEDLLQIYTEAAKRTEDLSKMQARSLGGILEEDSLTDTEEKR